MAGERLGVGGYKNASLAFRALAGLQDDKALALICVGGAPQIEPKLRELAPKLDVRRLALGDDDLRAAYAGAHALLYPSKYEGFGLPPLESMACGTPAIVCRNSSIPEVVGEAALYVDESDPTSMADAIMSLYNPDLRADLVERGLRQTAHFTFSKMARDLAQALVETHGRLRDGDVAQPSAAWSELRNFQKGFQEVSRELNTTQAEFNQALWTITAVQAELDQARRTAASTQAELDQARRTNVATQAELDQARRTNAATQAELDQALHMNAAMRNSPFWKARKSAVRVLRTARLRRRA